MRAWPDSWKFTESIYPPCIDSNGDVVTIDVIGNVAFTRQCGCYFDGRIFTPCLEMYKFLDRKKAEAKVKSELNEYEIISLLNGLSIGTFLGLKFRLLLIQWCVISGPLLKCGAK